MDRAARAVALYRNGLSMNAAGKAVGAHGQTVKTWLAAAGVSVRYSRPTYPAEVRNQAIRLYVTEELSARDVAKLLGLKDFTVKEWATAAGVMRSMSEAASISIAAGRPRARAASRLWHTSRKTGMRNFAESSLEFLRMEQLDADDSVVSWRRCAERIPYIAPDGRERRYNPDLSVKLADGRRVIEELKPLSLTGDPTNVAKFTAAKTYCEVRGWLFHVLTERDVGYCRSLAPSVLSPAERRQRYNDQRRERWAAETAEERARRLAKNAAYMRQYHADRRSSPTGLLRINAPRTPQP